MGQMRDERIEFVGFWSWIVQELQRLANTKIRPGCGQERGIGCGSHDLTCPERSRQELIQKDAKSEIQK